MFWTGLGCILLQVQGGFVIGENTRVGIILSQKLEWEGLAQNTALSVIGFAGLAFGPYLGGSIVHKIGLRNLLILSQFINVVANVVKIASLWYPALLFGRFLFGTGSGIISFCYGKALNETVPISVNQTYGLLTNVGFNMGVMVCGFVSLIMPESDAPVEDMIADETWRIVYGSTLILQLLGTIFILFFMKYPSLN